MEEILEFIKRRWRGHEDLFLNGNCYWFARILQDQFGTQICYLPIKGHFISKDLNGNYYDVTGLLNNIQEPILSLDEIKSKDPVWYQRLLRDCKN